MDSTRLQISNLSVDLPTGRKILDGASLTVSAGEVVVVLGLSGAGKSTLGDVLFDLLAERSPEILVSADEIQADETRMALVLQQGSLFDHLDVAGNIRFAARRRRNVRLSDDEVDTLLNEVGLTERNQSVSRLSGGEERRVNVARALATNPRLMFFDEPAAGLDVVNVRRVGSLIRKVCREHDMGAVVVTHNPLLAALTADQLLFLDRRDGSLLPLIDDWLGSEASEDNATVQERRDTIEHVLLARMSASEEAPTTTARRGSSAVRWLGDVASKGLRVLSAPGRLLFELLLIVLKLPRSLRHLRDFGQISWRALFLTGYSGLPFYGLVAAIFSATVLTVAFTAAELVSPDVIVDNLQGNFILAMTPPLCGFLFAARSGSALTAWLGGISLRRQTDALRSLGVTVHEYLRVPAFVGTFLGFVLTTIVFGAAMYLAAVITASGFGVVDAAETMSRTAPSFQRQLIEKTLLYGALVGVIGTHMGLMPKRTSQDVAEGITRSIIFCTLAVVLSELFFAIDLGVG